MTLQYLHNTISLSVVSKITKKKIIGNSTSKLQSMKKVGQLTGVAKTKDVSVELITTLDI